jgi:hypothetical protein
MSSHPSTSVTNRPPGPGVSGPVQQYLATRRPGQSSEGRYLVLPRELMEQLPSAVQHQLVQALARVHQITVAAPWPVYRVSAGRWAKLVDLDEDGLAEAGVIAELDAAGHLVHRWIRTGAELSDQDLQQYVTVSATDHLATR